ncbi:MAG: L-lysine 6-transaminase [Candidatus Kapabacteria bacterium]|nr:L-lysine 6-transaminase [Candidatus Kapabacteria bacterium]
MAMEKYSAKYHVPADAALDVLRKHMLVDGFDFVLDYDKSSGSRIVDKRNGKSYLDFFTFFASAPLGMNHPKMLEENFINYLGRVSVNKPSNSDIYTEGMATFVNTFFKIAVPDYFVHSFYVSGGALAVENALKTAIDWKVRKNMRKGIAGEKGTRILHFKQAFHGRTGYTMSLTNTDPIKIAYYPKFEWPRVTNPHMTFPMNEENTAKTIALEKQSIAEIKQAFIDYKDDIAAIIIEPIQAEGGDHHFRNEFMHSLREIADENEALLIFDEVQTGGGLSGTFWCHEQFGVIPDIISFGKKMQVCGVLATSRIDDIDDNVFHTSSRINSTWGGNYADMIRATKFLEIIEEENLLQNVRNLSVPFSDYIRKLVEKFPEKLSNPRGRGLITAFDFDTKANRNEFIKRCWDYQLIVLSCGERSIRFRPSLNICREEVDDGFEIMNKVMKTM